MPLILGTNSIKDTGYDVANSVRLDDGSSDGFSLSGQNGNRKTFTFSCWVKRGVFGENFLFNSRINASNHFLIRFTGDHKLELVNRTSASNNFFVTTNRLFRDVSSWYHIIVAVDTTQSTANDRVKFYVNGVQETSFATQTIGSQDADLSLNTSTATHYIGQEYTSGFNFFDGYLCETVFIDGQQLAPDQFGEFDSDSPTIWKPIDVSGLTFGTNGFHLDFENSSSLGADVSGNSNNFTVNNLTSLDQSTDTCTNNFCVLNPLEPHTNRNIFSEGNIVASGQAGAWQLARGTIGLTQGKWYWEVFFSGGTVGNYHAGVQVASATTYSSLHSQAGTTTFYNGDGGEIFTGSSEAFTNNDYGTMNGSSDILGVALNMDDKQISFYKNGSAIVTNYSLDTPNDTMMPLSVQYGSSQVTKINFGGTQHTAISSGNSDANGYGNFEYSVPSGYYSINTKNLAEFG